jgi:hypothetical protein
MTLTPPADFSKNLYLDDQQGSINLVAVTPLNYTSPSHTIAINDASSTNSGVVTTTAQTISGEKTFVSNVNVPTIPLDGTHVTSKAYVDNLCLYSQAWQPSIEKFHNFSAGDPSPIAVGFRYIALTTYGGLTKDYIYVVLTTTPGVTYQELIPVEGWALYDKATDENYIFTDAGVWSKFGLTLDHNDLINRGTTSHSTIDSYLNQAVKTTSSPSFANLNVGGALSIFSPDTASKVAITVDNTTGLMKFATNVYGGDYKFVKNGINGTLTCEGNIVADSTDDANPLTNSGSFYTQGGIWVRKSICLDNSSYGYMYRNYQDASNEHSLVSSEYGPLINARCSNSTPIWNFNNYSTHATPDKPFTLALNACNSTAVVGTTTIKTNQDGSALIKTTGTGTPLNTISFDAVDKINILNTTDSTSDTTGSLIVTGGASVAKNLSVGGEILIHSPNNLSKGKIGCVDTVGTTYFTPSTVGITKSFQFFGDASSGHVNIDCSTPSSSPITGGLTVVGGIGCNESINSLYSINAGTSITCQALRFTISGVNSYIQPYNNVHSVDAWNDIIFSGYFSTTPRYSFGQTKMTIHSSDQSTNNTSGCAVLSGGLGVAKNCNLGPTIGGYGATLMVNSSQTICASPFACADSTEATSVTSASISTLGGLGVSKRLIATQMTCLTAPSASTDVVRLNDLPDSPINIDALSVALFDKDIYMDFTEGSDNYYEKSGASIVSGMLDINYITAPKYVTFYGDIVSSVSAYMTFKCKVKTTYNTSPPIASYNTLLSMGKSTAHYESILLYHDSDGYIKVRLYNNAGTEITGSPFSFGIWSPISGTVYEICFCLDSVNLYNTRVFIDGVVLGTISTVYTRTNTSNRVCFGSDYETYSLMSYCSIGDVAFWNSVLHISNYTPSDYYTSYTGTGLTSIPRLVSTNRISSKRLSCDSAPFFSNDVLRYCDQPIFSSSDTGSSYWSGAGCPSNQSQTMYIRANGDVVTIGNKTRLAFTANGTGYALTLNNLIGMSYRPTTTSDYLIVITVGGIGGLARFNVGTSGLLSINYTAGWISGDPITIYPFCCQIMI